MVLYVAAIAAGLGVGWGRGGQFARLGDLRFRVPLLAVFACVVQVGSGLVPAGWRPLLLTASWALVAAWLLVNAVAQPALRTGLVVVALGIGANTVVMAANGGMPVSTSAARQVGLAADDIVRGHLWKHVSADDRTHLPWLGDMVRFPGLWAVVSLGDLVAMVGIAILVGAAMTMEVHGKLEPARFICNPGPPERKKKCDRNLNANRLNRIEAGFGHASSSTTGGSSAVRA